MHCSRLTLGTGFASGRGDYAVNNIINSPMDSSVVPKFGPSDSAITVSHVEYVRDIYVQPSSVVPFVVQTIPINAGLPAAFPWLSQLACNYEEYSLVQCIYTFKSTIGEVSTGNGQQGQILMATQYNPADEPFADKESMMMYAHSSSAKLSSTVLHGVECDPKLLPNTTGVKYVRTGGISQAQDIKEYDAGVLNIAISAPPATYLGQSVGELWVSYTVVLRKPKLGSLNGNSIPSDKFVYMTETGALFASRISIPWPDSSQYSCAKNSFGSKIYSLNYIWTKTAQPANVPLLGVPTPGSVADPLIMLSMDEPNVDNRLYTSPTSMNQFYDNFGATGVLYGLYCIELPDNFQGVAEIRWSQWATNPVAGQSLHTFSWLGGGNVYPFKDIIEKSRGSGLPRYGNCVRFCADAHAEQPNLQDDGMESVMHVTHVRVLAASNGLKNRVYLVNCTINASPPLSNISCTVFEVKVYNGTLSQKINGSADRLELVNTVSGLPFTRM